MGDRLTYDNITIEFIVDEYLENYRSLHEWMTAIGFPKDRKQFADFRANKSNTPSSTQGVSQDIGDVQPSTASDAYLTLLSNKNNPILEVNFHNCYPVALGGLTYSQQETDVEYMTTSATFSYQIYEFREL